MKRLSKASIAITIVLFGHLQLHAQSLTPFVIGSAGASFESSLGTLAWTIGEPLTGTYKTTNFLTQGFHQPTTISVTGVHVGEDESLVVYPNPVNDILHLQMSQPSTYHIELFNLQGQRLIDDQAVVDDAKRVHRVEVLNIPVALYILRVTNQVSGAVYHHKIEKQ